MFVQTCMRGKSVYPGQCLGLPLNTQGSLLKYIVCEYSHALKHLCTKRLVEQIPCSD